MCGLTALTLCFKLKGFFTLIKYKSAGNYVGRHNNDDGRKIAELKQQKSQKMILLRRTVTLRQCAAI